jgi:hypothetical protein
MADKILHKRSATPSAVPSAASLELGELALNTADGRAFMKKNDGAVVEIGSTASGYFRTEPITATATGQTSFTVPGGYTPGAIFVSLNGATLPPADFTATDGTTVVLASGDGVVAGSVLLVHVLSAFEVADALPLGGTAADSIKLGGIAAADFYRRANILGTVSQAGGVPTGALVQYISNSNGEAWRYAGGMQICTHSQSDTTAPTTADGSLYRSEGATWTYPASFAAPPAVDGAVNAIYEWPAFNPPTATSVAWVTWKPRVGSATRTATLSAIGRWY